MLKAPLTKWLNGRCRWQRLAGGLRCVLEALTGFAVICALLWGLEAATGRLIAERTATKALLGVGLVLVVMTAFRVWRGHRRGGVIAKVREFGRETPEEHDALEAAVELEAKGTLRPFEQEYLAQLQQTYVRDNFARLRRSRALRPPPWLRLLLATAAIGGLFLLVRPPILTRAWNGLAAREPGVQFLTLPAEIARHQDLEVVVQVNRYGGTPKLIVRDTTGQSETPMQLRENNRYHLVLYDVADAFELRAETQTVSSARQRHRVTVYDAPAPLRIGLDVIPPGYSGLPARHYDEFHNLDIPEGSLIQIRCEMPEGQAWLLKCLDQERLPDSGGALSLPSSVFSEKPALQAEYRDKAGHLATGPAFTITVRPDLPPVLEVLQPTNDSTCKPGETPAVVATAADDFGLTAVKAHYFLDNQPEIVQDLWQNTAGTQQKQLEITTTLALGNEELVPGQLLTGWLEATDNREPTTQSIRSDLFFVTIVPDENAFEATSEGMEGDEAHEVSITDLIVEGKRLLRNTFDLLDTSFEKAIYERLRQELERDLRALELAVRARGIDLAQQFGMTQLPPQIQNFLNEAAIQLVQAAADVTTDALADARTPQQLALVNLVQLNNLLMENRMRMSGEGGESTPEPGDASDKASEGEQLTAQPQTAAAERQQQIEQLEKAHAELQKILQEQRALLDDIRRASRLADEYAQPERLLALRTRNVADILAAIAEAEPMQVSLRNAWTELDNSGQNFAATGGQSAAVIHARRAEKSLADALTMLERLLQELTAKQIEKLSEDARKLSERQKELAELSRDFAENPPDDAQRKKVREEQNGLMAASEDLRSRIDYAAHAMESDNPQTAKNLRSAMPSENQAVLQRAQTRAKNAITYRRYESAALEQETAAAELEKLAGRLADIAMQTGLSPEELQTALEEMQRLGEEAAKGQNAEELAEVAQEASAMANQTGRKLGNETLQMLAQELAEADTSGLSPELQRARLLERIDQVREELREELARQTGGASNRRLSPTTAPPRQYRQEVEEYFRRLGE